MKSRIRWNFLLGQSLDADSFTCDGVVVLAEHRAFLRQRRNRGQALLLAVLIMLLAALLSAGVLAVVSGNLNQTARIADKTRAIEASRAGIAYANAQLSSSANGDLWRPVDVSPVPATNDAAYNSYYSQLDKAQGWARDPATTPRDQLYAKFPAPNQAIGDAPKFLVKVEEIPLNSTTDMEHAGEIKITSIGLSDDDPNVFNTAIAYKEGQRKSPFANALRSVSNWDFGSNRVPQARVSTVVPDAITGTTMITVENAALQGTFPAAPFNVVLSHKDTVTPTNSRTFGGVVMAVAPAINSNSSTTQYKIAGVAPTGFVANDTLQIAAALGTASTIDLLNTGSAPSSVALQTFPMQSQPNGILANGSLWLQGQYQLTSLQKAGNKVQCSGAIFLSGTTSLAASKPVAMGGDVATAGDLVPSSASGFPGTFATTSGVAKTDLINDGWNTIGAQTLGLNYFASRGVEPFEPAKIDSDTNLARYRALARNSFDGVYIDNRDDVEKVGTQPMTQAQLLEMLMSPKQTTPTDYTRLGTAAAGGATGVSLEQRHLRGWVGPDEFLARGALVELSPLADLAGNAPSIRVTYDARSDANFTGPDIRKTVRDASGNPRPGVYSQTLPWPKNGTLLAEGNLRVRGDLGTVAAPNSLTVISLNNIYIEGSLSVDNTMAGTVASSDRKKLMLMAKKNIIVNPTRAVLARTDVQTVATNAAAINVSGTPTNPATATIPVADGAAFHAGDYVLAEGQRIESGIPVNKPIRGLVTTNNATQIAISTADSGIIAAAGIVRSPLEKRQMVTVGADQEFFSQVDTENALNRRLVAPIFRQTTASNKLLFDHVGELKQTGGINDHGLKIKAEDFSATVTRPTDFTAELTNKQKVSGANSDNDPTTTNITRTNKRLRIFSNFPMAPNPEEFAASSTKNLTQFAAEISRVARDNGAMPAKGYKYNSQATSTAVGALPSFALTGVGLRYAPRAHYDSTMTNWRQNINTAQYTVIPLATSVEFDLNGTLTRLGVVGLSISVNTSYLGFNPAFDTSDDALTVDSNFYHLPNEIFNSTLDARNVVLGLTSGPTTRVDFPQSIVLKRSIELSDSARSDLLPAYKVRALKMENYDSTNDDIQPAGDTMQINAFAYAQEGSWLVIPGDYFRTNPPIRGIMDGNNALVGSYIDYNNNKAPDAPTPGQATEYIENSSKVKVADLNRNGKDDTGEREAALQYVRYNTVQIEFYGAIVENQTAVVADVASPTTGNPPIVKGAVQDWMDKWASYNDVGVAPKDVGKPNLFKFINYAYDPSIANGSTGANQLRIPLTDDLIYQQ